MVYVLRARGARALMSRGLCYVVVVLARTKVKCKILSKKFQIVIENEILTFITLVGAAAPELARRSLGRVGERRTATGTSTTCTAVCNHASAES